MPVRDTSREPSHLHHSEILLVPQPREDHRTRSQVQRADAYTKTDGDDPDFHYRHLPRTRCGPSLHLEQSRPSVVCEEPRAHRSTIQERSRPVAVLSDPQCSNLVTKYVRLRVLQRHRCYPSFEQRRPRSSRLERGFFRTWPARFRAHRRTESVIYHRRSDVGSATTDRSQRSPEYCSWWPPLSDSLYRRFQRICQLDTVVRFASRISQPAVTRLRDICGT